MTNKQVYIQMVFAAMFWSGAFITGKIVTTQYPPFALTFFRFLFSLPFIFWILYIKQHNDWKPRRQEWPALILLGIIGTFMYHVLFFASLKYTTAINSSLIGATNPMITSLIAFLFLKEKLNYLRIFGIILSFFGVSLIVTNGDIAAIIQLQLNLGDVLMFLGVCFFATYTVLSRQVMNKLQISPLKITAYTFLVCTVVSIPFFLYEGPNSYLAGTTLGGWLSIAYMAVFASVLGYLFQLMAIQQIGAPKAAIFINLVPVFTIIQSVIILKEHFDVLKFISAVIIILGVYLTTRPEK